MQEFDLPKKGSKLADIVLNIETNESHQPLLEGGDRAISFLEFITKLQEYKWLLPTSNYELSDGHTKMLNVAAQRLAIHFLPDSEAPTLETKALQMFSVNLALPDQYTLLPADIALLRKATADIEPFEELFRQLREESAKYVKGAQNLRNNPDKEREVLSELKAIDHEAINEEVIQRNKACRAEPISAAKARASLSPIDMENVIVGGNEMVKAYDGLIAQAENARALMNCIANRAEAIYRKRLGKFEGNDRSKGGPS